MWLASAFLHLTSAASTSAASPSSLSFLSHALAPRALLVGTCRSRRPARSQQGTAAAAAVLSHSRRFVADVACTSSSPAAAGGGGGEGGSMVPEDAASLLRSVYRAKPTPQVCLSSTGSGGQALAWLLGVPGASSCLLEMTVPYCTEAFDEKLDAGPPASGYVSREAAEGLARDAYARAVALCVAGSDRGPHALVDKRIVGVGSTAAVVSSRMKTGLHRCFVCTRTAQGFAHYELNLAKGRRDRNGEDNAVSRVLLQAIAEAAGVTVPVGFKSDHLFLDTRGQADGGDTNIGDGVGTSSSSRSGSVASDAAGDGQESLSGGEGGGAAGGGRGGGATEVMPVAELSPECDAIEELVSGRSSAALIVPAGGGPLPGGSAPAPAPVPSASSASSASVSVSASEAFSAATGAGGAGGGGGSSSSDDSGISSGKSDIGISNSNGGSDNNSNGNSNGNNNGDTSHSNNGSRNVISGSDNNDGSSSNSSSNSNSVNSGGGKKRKKSASAAATAGSVRGASKEIAETQTTVVLQDSAVKAALPRGATVILPGSFNPVHRGHLGLLEAARRLLSEKLQSEQAAAGHPHPHSDPKGVAGDDGDNGRRLLGVATVAPPAATALEGEGAVAVHAVFELSVANADKGGLEAEEIRRRARQFGEAGGVGWPGPLLISRAPLFSQKARLFPGCAFVVGADTAKRVVDPKYYGNSQVEMVAALAEIRHLGCSFIVGGREDGEGVFLTLDGVLERSGLPESLRAMFHGLHESAFRENLSSTSIRAMTAAKANP